MTSSMDVTSEGFSNDPGVTKELANSIAPSSALHATSMLSRQFISEGYTILSVEVIK